MRARALSLLLVAPVLLAGCDRSPTSTAATEPRLAVEEPLLAAASGSARITSAAATGPGTNGELAIDFTLSGLGAKNTSSVTGGASVDATWACSFAGVIDAWPAPVVLSQVGRLASVVPSGTGQVSGRLTLSPPASPASCVANHTNTLVSDSYSSVSVSFPTSGSVPIAGTYARTFLTLPSETFPNVTSASIAQSIFVFDGGLVGFNATIDNPGAARSGVAWQAWITQPSGFIAANGALVNCGGALGDLPTGTCNIQGQLAASTSATGIGTVGPGAAVLDLTLKEGASPRILAGWRFNITLQ